MWATLPSCVQPPPLPSHVLTHAWHADNAGDPDPYPPYPPTDDDSLLQKVFRILADVFTRLSAILPILMDIFLGRKFPRSIKELVDLLKAIDLNGIWEELIIILKINLLYLKSFFLIIYSETICNYFKYF